MQRNPAARVVTERGGNAAIFADRTLEQTGNAAIIGGAVAGGKVPAGPGALAFPGPVTLGREPDPGRDPGEDTAAWLPSFAPSAPAPAPAPTLALRHPVRPVQAEPPPLRRPLILPSARNGGPAEEVDA